LLQSIGRMTFTWETQSINRNTLPSATFSIHTT